MTEAEERRARVEQHDEIVYFHLFVRDFLYGDVDSRPSMRVLRRDDVKGVRLALNGNDARSLVLGVARVELYVFDTEIALFVIEVEHPAPGPRPAEGASLALDEVEDLLDQFRRAYPPYWSESGGKVVGGRTPAEVTWLDAAGTPRFATFTTAGRQAEHACFVAQGAEPPVSAHWRELLKPLTPYKGGAKQVTETGVAQQIEDERIPSMSYIAFDRVRDLTQGDMVRLAFLDEHGPSDELPYSRTFLKDFDAQYAFDLFWGPKTEAPTDSAIPLGPATPEDLRRRDGPWLTTRYLCSGYGFTVLGADESFFRNAIEHHFRHHYFKLVLIAHFHRASLLMFADRLSEAVKEFSTDPGESKRYVKFRGQVRTIFEDFLKFRSRYWFTEVSNQVQPRALFDLMSRHLLTRDLFAQVLDEVRSINDFLTNREQARQNAETVRLSVVATVGLAASIFVNALPLQSKTPSLWFAGYFAAVAVIVAVVAYLVISFSGIIGSRLRKTAELGQRYTDRVVGGWDEAAGTPRDRGGRRP